MIFRRVLCWLAWVFIAITCLLTLILNFGPVEFSNPGATSIFEGIRAIGIAACIAMLILIRIRAADAAAVMAIKIGGAIVLPIVFMFFLGLAGFASGMCVWSEHRTLFVHVSDPDHRIVVRDLGCGATDSSPPVFKVVEMKSLTGLFTYVEKVDTSAIDRTQWQQVKTER